MIGTVLIEAVDEVLAAGSRYGCLGTSSCLGVQHQSGTLAIVGHPVVVVPKVDQLVPELGRRLLPDKADRVLVHYVQVIICDRQTEHR